MSQRSDGKDTRRSGIEGCLTKPVRQSHLYETLAAVVGSPETDSVPPEERLITTHTLSETKDQSRIRLLLAEDNPVNQKVAVRTLEKLGYRVDVAADGLEALEALSKSSYAAILMDVQMPRMDGYETTREIRRRESEGGGHTPVIAMTANAMEGDREKALEAGMDDYISKPVRQEQLEGVLQHWIPSERTKDAAEERQIEANGESVAGYRVLNPAVLAGLEEFEEEDGPSIVAELAGMFLEDASARIETLREAVESGSSQDVRKVAHTLKGSNGNMGAHRMQEICAELQEAGESGDLSNASELLEQLEAEFGRVRPELVVLTERS